MARVAAGTLQDVRVIGLVSFGHMLSHFYFMVFPPILPLMKAEFDVPYAAMGLLMTGFGLAAFAVQTPVGFLVDRIGARQVLVCGLFLESASVAAIGLTSAFWQILVLYTLAGVFNTVFHPADYAILSGSVARQRMGRAFSIHLFSGHMGWVIAPAALATLSAQWDWRTAFLVVGAVGMVFALFLATQSGALGDERPAAAAETAATGPAGDELRQGLRLLTSLPVMMCLLFFIMLTLGFTGVRSFFVTAMDILYGMTLETANVALTVFLTGSVLGILAGGVLADRVGPRVATASVTLLSGGAILIVLGLVALPTPILMAVLAISGFLQGVLLPSRDLLIRQVTPAGSMGKVMGFLSSGMMFASGLVPILFGWLVDIGQAAWVFWLSGIFVVGALGTFTTARARAAIA